MPAKLSTHVLDIAHGCPAPGMKIELWLLEGDDRTLVTTAKTNADGRTDQPLLSADEMKPGQYEIIFFVGDYFTARGTPLPKTRFFDKVPVRFGHCRRRCKLPRSSAVLALGVFDVSRNLMKLPMKLQIPTSNIQRSLISAKNLHALV